MIGSAQDIQRGRVEEIPGSVKDLIILDKKNIIPWLDYFLSGQSIINYYSSVYNQIYFVGVVILMAVSVVGYNYRIQILTRYDGIHRTDTTLAYICLICFMASLLAIVTWIASFRLV